MVCALSVLEGGVLVTVSMRLMTAGDGYKYLLQSVAAGDGERDLATPLTRYYTSAGTPPGRWLGAGVASLELDSLHVGDQVSEVQLRQLVGEGCNPVTGEALGRPYLNHASVQQRVAARVALLDAALDAASRDALVQQIGDEEAARGMRRTIAAYDYTFSVPKSVSVLWGVADAGVQELIAAAHHAAVTQVVGFMERQIVATRIGASTRGGPAAQAGVTGVLATAFDHYDSRAGDPQLHTHVVISNKVRTISDGRWRAIDGRPMHAATVAVSELYNAALGDELAGMFGWEWGQRQRGRDRNPAWEINGVPDELIAEFSSRSADIDVEKDRLVAAFVAAHGHQPDRATVLKLRQQATLATRPAKELHSLAELTAGWRERAGTILGADATGWARQVAATGGAVIVRADDVPQDTIDNLGRAVMGVVGEKRSTWTRWNLHAEASRQTMGWRFASLADRETVTRMIVDAAQAASLRLTPAEMAVPDQFRRADGTSVFRPANMALYSSQDLMDAETALVKLSRDTAGPVVPLGMIEQMTGAPDGAGQVLSDDQATALAGVATSGRVVDVLVGPAGAGKTTALASLREVWEAEHGPGSVGGLAPSATAAAVLGEDLGIPTENTARWLTMHDLHGDTFSAGQLVIVDEASLAGTFTLTRIASLAAGAGAKMLLVGDWAQLQSVDAGGAFHLLASDRADTPELADIHRFKADWEKAASLGLRHGNPDVIDTYIEHGRVIEGDTEQMIEDAYQAWHTDLAAGKASLLIADNQTTVTELNLRARRQRITDGQVDLGRSVALGDGGQASAGDMVITRRNDRRLVAGRTGWVRNGDRWIVTKVHRDGSVVVRRAGLHHGGTLTLPADYANQYLDLGYAVTSFRAQGVTVDTAHVVVTGSTTRENLYVGLTRGRDANMAYVATDRPDQVHDTPHPADLRPNDARQVLAGVLTHVGAELSAHQTQASEAETWGNITQLDAEYETLTTAALEDRWAAVITTALPEPLAEQVLASEAFGALAAELARADTVGWNPEAQFPRLAAASTLADAHDPAAVLHARLTRVIDDLETQPRRRRTDYLLGMYPQIKATTSPAMRRALTQRETAMRTRAASLLRQASADRAPWLTALPPRPAGKTAASRWTQALLAIAAYRDRYQVDTPEPFGDPVSLVQRRDAARIQAMLTATQASQPQPAHNGPHRQNPALQL